MNLLQALVRPFRRPRRIGRVRIAVSVWAASDGNPVLGPMRDALMEELTVLSRVEKAGVIIITALCDQFDPILPGDPIPFYRFSYQMDASAGGFRSRCTFDRVFQSDLPPAPVRPVPPSAPAAAAPEPATAKEDPA